MKERRTLDFDEAPPLRVTPFIRLAQYYETDQMGIIHHSHYIRWMEEARVDVMEQIGFGYKRMEQMGVYSPVLGVSIDYKGMVCFHDRVRIECRIGAYTGLQLTMLYHMTDLESGDDRTYAQSRHGFLDSEGHIISLKRKYPEVHELILGSMIREEARACSDS